MKFLIPTLFFALSACTKTEISTQPSPTMTSIQEIETRSGIKFPPGSRIVGQSDAVGKVQQAQSWVLQVPNDPTLPAIASRSTASSAAGNLKVMKARAPKVDFGSPIKDEFAAYWWETPGSSWSYTNITTETGSFVALGWVKQ
jgi:hypothetical protein